MAKSHKKSGGGQGQIYIPSMDRAPHWIYRKFKDLYGTLMFLHNTPPFRSFLLVKKRSWPRLSDKVWELVIGSARLKSWAFFSSLSLSNYQPTKKIKCFIFNNK